MLIFNVLKQTKVLQLNVLNTNVTLQNQITLAVNGQCFKVNKSQIRFARFCLHSQVKLGRRLKENINSLAVYALPCEQFDKIKAEHF